MVGLACPSNACEGAIVAAEACPAGLLSLQELPAAAGTAHCSMYAIYPALCGLEHVYSKAMFAVTAGCSVFN